MKLKRYNSINKQSALPTVKNVIAVTSGKGGVGKSTVAFSLATMMHSLGLSVGLVDADIYGPSLAQLSGITDKASVRHDKFFEPHLFKGMPLLSIAHLVEKEQALAWRGPMASGALMQLINQTAWPELDLLIIDMPPGTGDIHLTLGQKSPLTGAILVTNTHPLSLDDYKRGKTLYQKLNVPIIGTIVNNLHAQKEIDTASFKDIFAPYLGLLEFSQDLYDATANSSLLREDQKGFDNIQALAQSVLKSIETLMLWQDIPFKVK